MKVHTINYELSSFLINSQGKLGPYHLLNILQDAASSHAQKLGFGFNQMTQLKMFWVLTRQKLIMHRWPQWHDLITIKTWIRAQTGVVSNRDFRIYQGEELIGECTTSWLPLSTESRKPVLWDRTALFADIQHQDQVSIEVSKITPKSEGEKLMVLQVRNSDIDQNMHVNNTKYAQWILDAVPFKDPIQFDLREYEVNFLLETKRDDQIGIKRTTLDENRTHFQGVRESDEKVVFTALLRHSSLITRQLWSRNCRNEI